MSQQHHLLGMVLRRIQLSQIKIQRSLKKKNQRSPKQKKRKRTKTKIQRLIRT